MKKFIKENWFKIGVLLILVIALCGIFFANHKKPAEEISKITNTHVKNGNIFIDYENGKEKQVTFSGLDDQPSLSSDLKKIVFLRNIPGKVYANNLTGNNLNNIKLPGITGNDENGDYLILEQIVLLNISDLSEKTIFKSGIIKDKYIQNGNDFTNIFDVISGLNSPLFSADNNKIYFSSAAWATSNAIFSVDINSGQLSYITDGNSLNIIADNKYNNDILVLKHKYYEDTDGSYDHYYIIDQDGNEIKDVGGYDKTPEEVISSLK